MSLGVRICRRELETIRLAGLQRRVLQGRERFRIVRTSSQVPVRLFSATAFSNYPRQTKTTRTLPQEEEVEQDKPIEEEPKETPQELVQATLERAGQAIMLDDGRLLNTIDPEKSTYQENLRICLSRIHPILLYQYFHEKPEEFVIGYAHRKTPQGRARDACLYLFISAVGWFEKALRAARRDGIEFDEELIYVTKEFQKTFNLVEAYINDTLSEGETWTTVASSLVECVTNAPVLWKKDFGDFEPLPIVANDTPNDVDDTDFPNDAAFEAEMERIWNEVESGDGTAQRKSRIPKSSKRKGELGFIFGDKDADMSKEAWDEPKKANAADEFFNNFRSFLQSHMKKK